MLAFVFSVTEIFFPAVMPLLKGKVAKQSSEMAVSLSNGSITKMLQPEIEDLVFTIERYPSPRYVVRNQTHCQRDVKQFLNRLSSSFRSCN